MARIRSCNFCLELYPDNFEHFVVCDSLDKSGYQYSAIVHNKDVQKDDPAIPVKPHWHIVLCFPQCPIPLQQQINHADEESTGQYASAVLQEWRGRLFGHPYYEQ